jgi:hypothetical protein
MPMNAQANKGKIISLGPVTFVRFPDNSTQTGFRAKRNKPSQVFEGRRGRSQTAHYKREEQSNEDCRSEEKNC